MGAPKHWDCCCNSLIHSSLYPICSGCTTIVTGQYLGWTHLCAVYGGLSMPGQALAGTTFDSRNGTWQEFSQPKPLQKGWPESFKSKVDQLASVCLLNHTVRFDKNVFVLGCNLQNSGYVKIGPTELGRPVPRLLHPHFWALVKKKLIP